MRKGVPRGYVVDHEDPDEFSVRCTDCGLLKLHSSRAGAHSHADNHGITCAPTAVKPLTRKSERPQPGDVATLTYESIRSENPIDVGGPILDVNAFDGDDLETETACEIAVDDSREDRVVLARFDPAGGQMLDAYSITEGQNTRLGELVDVDVKPVATDGGTDRETKTFYRAVCSSCESAHGINRPHIHKVGAKVDQKSHNEKAHNGSTVAVIDSFDADAVGHVPAEMPPTTDESEQGVDE
ncbi:hypothetical protein SAMN06269185_1505 [Natronoarchaeum philippinense]|uniref:Uncharacterized protein n=1 Tax=Natronoarchaeum philippinense TaxID=558529 RepID=A0A285NRN5_NATPI|nr:hypothetical protein [Natronoarchaeum philippinense]SNZ12119.1 hypothetical protein SAMN06269185_1505 [Natronoarchaeum philippinense]